MNWKGWLSMLKCSHENCHIDMWNGRGEPPCGRTWRRPDVPPPAPQPRGK